MTNAGLHELTNELRRATEIVDNFAARLKQNPPNAITQMSNVFGAIAVQQLVSEFLSLPLEKRPEFVAHNREVIFASTVDMAGSVFHALYFSAQKDARLLIERCSREQK